VARRSSAASPLPRLACKPDPARLRTRVDPCRSPRFENKSLPQAATGAHPSLNAEASSRPRPHRLTSSPRRSVRLVSPRRLWLGCRSTLPRPIAPTSDRSAAGQETRGATHHALLAEVTTDALSSSPKLAAPLRVTTSGRRRRVAAHPPRLRWFPTFPWLGRASRRMLRWSSPSAPEGTGVTALSRPRVVPDVSLIRELTDPSSSWSCPATIRMAAVSHGVLDPSALAETGSD